MKKVLKRKFFDRPTLFVAKELLGKFLVRKVGRKEITGIITEVEAYVGPMDKASHASRGETSRCRIMFGQAGNWYVYFIYGMHWMLNIVTERRGYPAAVLIRGTSDACGPGRLTKFLHVDKNFNGKPAKKNSGLWIENRGAKIPKLAIGSGKRIGVEYAPEIWKNKPWRFYIAGE